MSDPIRNRDFMRQIKRFHGLKFERNIAPTDIDAFLDFGGRLFVFIETKHGTTALPKGQRMALERLCDACQAQHRKSILLVTSHTDGGDIDLANTRVEMTREDGKWTVGEGRALRATIDDLVRRHAPECAPAERRVSEPEASTPPRPGLRKAEPIQTPKKSSSQG